MSLHGIQTSLHHAPIHRTPGTDGRARVQPPTAQPAAASAVSTAASAPVEPPPGTDPELWSVLSAEERAFFAKAGAMGPLTYGRVAATAAQSPALRGGRLDVRA